MKSRAVRIPDDLWEPLKHQSLMVGSDASKIIRELVEEWLESQGLFRQHYKETQDD